ncbi:MAG: hypothetical protein Q9220_001654 [cf. Caloplaca sp. 1 TL-2023]
MATTSRAITEKADAPGLEYSNFLLDKESPAYVADLVGLNFTKSLNALGSTQPITNLLDHGFAIPKVSDLADNSNASELLDLDCADAAIDNSCDHSSFDDLLGLSVDKFTPTESNNHSNFSDLAGLDIAEPVLSDGFDDPDLNDPSPYPDSSDERDLTNLAGVRDARMAMMEEMDSAEPVDLLGLHATDLTADTIPDRPISSDVDELYFECPDSAMPDFGPEMVTKVPQSASSPHSEDQEAAEEASETLSDAESEPQLSDPNQKLTQKEKSQQAQQEAKLTTDKEISRREMAAGDKTDPIHGHLNERQSYSDTIAREYQIELCERAKKQNIIAVLDTGSGKTYIAVLLMQHILDIEQEDRSMGKKPRVLFFLVDSVALVFQQSEYIKEFMQDRPLASFCGEMGTDMWTKSAWTDHLERNMIIVCTAEILNQLLGHSFVRIDQINLLIFDEAHHAKKNHPYARIIKDFYITEDDQSKRPKVFGMTASPVDVRSDFSRAARELETMLHCQIATTANLALLRKSVSRPQESVAVYPPLQFSYQTELCEEMYGRCGEMEKLKKIFKHAREATSQLGEWCADQVWAFAMSEHGAMKLEQKIEKHFNAEDGSGHVQMLDAELNRLREAQAFVHGWDFREPIYANSLSGKVKLLQDYLNVIFERPTDHRCIVFIHQRYIARLLHKLFARIGSPHLRLGLLVGTRPGELGDLNMTWHKQKSILKDFRKGTLNCLVTISPCRMGIDEEQQLTIHSLLPLLPRRVLIYPNAIWSYGPNTGQSRSVDSVQSDASLTPSYNVTAEHGQYTCEVVLPEASPILAATGRPAPQKAIAKRSAAFEACILLRKGGHLDENFISTHHKYLPAMRNAHLALSLNKSSSYDMQVKPSIWQATRGSIPDSLYMTILELEQPECLGRPSQPMALLTRTRMPEVPAISIHPQISQTSKLNIRSLPNQIQISRQNLSKINTFSLRIYKDVFNKTFEDNESMMSYWFAPVLQLSVRSYAQKHPIDLIDWKAVDFAYENEEWIWHQNRTDMELEGRYLVDKWDGGRRLWTIKVLPDLSPRDPVPEDAAPHPWMNSIIDYSVSLFAKSRERAKWREDQPVIFAHRVLHRLNWLDEYTEEETRARRNAYICPEPFLFSAVSVPYAISD